MRTVLLTMSDGYCRVMLIRDESATADGIARSLERISRNRDGSFKPGYPVVSWRFAEPADEGELRDRRHREALRDVNGVLAKDPDVVREREIRERALEILSEERVEAYKAALSKARGE